MKQNKSPSKWRHFEPSIILLCVRWYCGYQLSYRLDKTYVKVGNEGLVKRLEGRDTIEQPKFAESLSGVAA